MPDANDQAPKSDEELVELYLRIRAHCEAEQAALDAELKDYKAGMQNILDEFLRRFAERGNRQSKVESGTAFTKRHLNAKVVGRDDFLKFCLDNWATFGADIIKVGTSTTDLREWMEKNPQAVPPGLEVSETVTCEIRKA